MYGSLYDTFHVYKEHLTVKRPNIMGSRTKQIHFRQVNSSEVLCKLKKVKTGKTSGYHTISAMFIKLGENVSTINLQ